MFADADEVDIVQGARVGVENEIRRRGGRGLGVIREGLPREEVKGLV